MKPNTDGRSRVEPALWLAALTLAAAALYLGGLTVFSVWSARSGVPWRDQWTYIEDAKQILAHDWPRLWYCYWGRRYVSVRVINVIVVSLFSRLNSPVVAF